MTARRALRGTGEARVAPESTRGHSGAPGASVGRFGGFDSELEWWLMNRIVIARLPAPVTQFKFCPTRRWRADFAWPEQRVIVEVQGGIWTGGRHARGSGIAAEAEKLSTAAALGYRVLPVTREMIEDGRAVALIRQALEPLP